MLLLCCINPFYVSLIFDVVIFHLSCYNMFSHYSLYGGEVGYKHPSISLLYVFSTSLINSPLFVTFTLLLSTANNSLIARFDRVFRIISPILRHIHPILSLDMELHVSPSLWIFQPRWTAIFNTIYVNMKMLRRKAGMICDFRRKPAATGCCIGSPADLGWPWMRSDQPQHLTVPVGLEGESERHTMNLSVIAGTHFLEKCPKLPHLKWYENFNRWGFGVDSKTGSNTSL